MPQGTLWHIYSVLIDVLQLRTRGKQNQVNEMGVAGGESRKVPAGGGETVEPICHSSSFSVVSFLTQAQATGSFRLASEARFFKFMVNHVIRNAS